MLATGGRCFSGTLMISIVPSRKSNSGTSSSSTNKVNVCSSAKFLSSLRSEKTYCATPVLPRWITEVENPIFTVFRFLISRGAILQQKILHAREAQDVLHRRLQAGESEMKRVLLRKFSRTNHDREARAI